MKIPLNILSKSKLFAQMTEDEISSALKCLKPSVKNIAKQAMVYFEGEIANTISIVLSGEVQTQKADFEGNVNIISSLFAGEAVALTACCSSSKRLPFDIVAISDCQILQFDANKLLNPCQNACSFHQKLVQNAISIVADRSISLTRKIDILTKRTTREKVLSYLFARSKAVGKTSFSVTHTRQQMAEFLSVNRSALSRELSILRQQGVLDFDKNKFKLL